MAYLGPLLTAALGREINVLEALPCGPPYPRPHVSILNTEDADGNHELLVLKRYRDAEALEHETQALALAAQAGVRIPDVVVSQPSPDSPIGAPFVVMTRLDGRHLDEVPADEAAPILTRLAEVVTQLHAAHADARGAPCSPGQLEQGREIDPRALAERLRYWLEVAAPALREHQRENLAELAATLAQRLTEWLEREPNLLAAFTPTLLHGDLHVSNILVSDGGDIGLIDWGESCRGDAAVDLAYLYVRSLWLCFPQLADGALSDLTARHTTALKDDPLHRRIGFYVGANVIAMLRRCAEWDRLDLADRLAPLLD